MKEMKEGSWLGEQECVLLYKMSPVSNDLMLQYCSLEVGPGTSSSLSCPLERT